MSQRKSPEPKAGCEVGPAAKKVSRRAHPPLRRSAVAATREAGNGSLNERAYSEIKLAVITHLLRPGQKVSEGMLAEKFKLTKAPVRAAMRRLVEDGLIVTKSSKLQTIAPLTFTEIREVFTLRNLLEPEAAREAARWADIGELRRLNTACMRNYAFGEPREELAFLESNKAFHVAIARASRNARLSRWIEQLQDAAMRILWFALQIDNRPQTWAQGHAEIIEAFEHRDGEAVAKKAREHLLLGQQTVLDVLMTSSKLKNFSLGERE